MLDMNMNSGLTIVMVIIAIVMIVGLLWGVWAAATARRERPEQPSDDHDPADVLRDRYARGEIATGEYEERRRALEREPTRTGGG